MTKAHAIDRFPEIPPSQAVYQDHYHHLDGADRVFINLINNSFDAMRAGGTLSVSTRPDEEWVIIDLADTGEGIAAEQIELIFDPLFTTKPGRGTGRGLTVVKQIVSGHGGTIQVESRPGRGTAFRIKLPFNAGLPSPTIEAHQIGRLVCGHSVETSG